MTQVVLDHLDSRYPALVGTRAEVVEQLRAARETGRLLAWSRPVDVPGRPGVILVRVQTRPPESSESLDSVPASRPATSPWWRRVPGWAWATGALTTLALLGGIGWAVWTVLAMLTAHLADVGGTLLLVALVLALAGGGTCTIVVTVRHRH